MAERRAVPRRHVARRSEDRGRAEDFAALLERLRPECEALIAQYEHKRSALLPIMHLFQEHEGFVSLEAMNAAARDARDDAGGGRGGRFVLYAAVSPPRGEVHAAGLPRPGVHDQRRGGHHGVLSREARHRAPADDAGRPLLVRRGRVSGGVRPRDVHGGQPRVRVRSDAAEDRRDARGDARGHVSGRADGADADTRADVGDRRRTRRSRKGRKSPGAVAVENPNNAGGVGDASGTIMLDHLINGDVYLFGRTTERAVVDSRAVVETIDEAGGSCRSLKF